jgi:hypothetical protein
MRNSIPLFTFTKVNLPDFAIECRWHHLSFAHFL